MKHKDCTKEHVGVDSPNGKKDRGSVLEWPTL